MAGCTPSPLQNLSPALLLASLISLHILPTLPSGSKSSTRLGTLGFRGGAPTFRVEGGEG